MFPFTSRATCICTAPDALASRGALVSRLEGALRAAGATDIEVTAATVRFTGTRLDIRRLGRGPGALQGVWDGTVELSVAPGATPGTTRVRGTVVLRYSPALWLATAVPGLVATLVALVVLPAWGLARWWALAIPVVQAMVLAWDVPRATLALVDQALAGEIETRGRARAV